MKYKDDRDFTDYVNTNLAIPIIYSKMDWQSIDHRSIYTDQNYKKDVIHYQAIDILGLKVTIR